MLLIDTIILEHLRYGNSVKRRSWPKHDALFCQRGQKLFPDEIELVALVRSGSCTHLALEDIHADDWYRLPRE